MYKRSKCEPEFKEQAVSLALNSQLSQTQISEELGISQSLLSRWVREHRARYERGSDSEELVRLWRENARLKRECAFLRKAADYFAHASNPRIK
ncbi:MAG: transposase [Gammaproteobacteria bacterium]|nr:transposase [Gammaproteobacteria bacterium]MYD81437.1 transposase [Gammaproteobacteria bacterium]